MGFEAKKTEHCGAKHGNGAYWVLANAIVQCQTLNGALRGEADLSRTAVGASPCPETYGVDTGDNVPVTSGQHSRPARGATIAEGFTG
jgi:hypothetical protein